MRLKKLFVLLLLTDEEIKKFDCRTSLENTYELLNGQRLVVGKERFLCPETLFKPAYVGLECEGIIEIFLTPS